MRFGNVSTNESSGKSARRKLIIKKLLAAECESRHSADDNSSLFDRFARMLIFGLSLDEPVQCVRSDTDEACEVAYKGRLHVYGVSASGVERESYAAHGHSQWPRAAPASQLEIFIQLKSDTEQHCELWQPRRN